VRPPVQEIVGNLIWATDGSVWARGGRTGLLPLPVRPGQVGPARQDPGGAHEPAHRVDGPGLCEPIDPTAVVEGMTQGVDISAHPEWAEVALAALDDLVGQALWRRCFFLVVRLAQQSEGAKAWSGALRAAQSQVLGPLACMSRR